MSEAIQKVLTNNLMGLPESAKSIGRQNIDAQKTLAYSYDGTRITAIDNSAVGLNSVSANNCISGDGSSGSPLGLSATAQWTAGGNWYPMTEISAGYLKISAQAFAGAQIYQNESSLCNWTPTGITVRHTASAVGGGNIDNLYGEIINLNYNAGQYYLRQISSDASGLRAKQNGSPNNVSIFGFGSAAFSDDDGSTWEVVDPASIRRWNGYSATTVSAGNGITGDGSTGSPLGLSSKIKLETSYSSLSLQPNYILVNNHVGSSQIGNGYVTLTTPLLGGATAHLNGSALRFTDSSNHTAQVDISSIDKWNANVWNESGNSLSTGIGGNLISAASQYNYSGNWAGRTVSMSGLPDQTMYGFQSRPNGTGTYGINQAGAFVAVPQQHYFTYLYHKTGEGSEDLGASIYPTGLTADARLDFVNLCSGMSANIQHDTFHGATATIDPGQSATMWYIATANIWTDGRNPVPV